MGEDYFSAIEAPHKDYAHPWHFDTSYKHQVFLSLSALQAWVFLLSQRPTVVWVSSSLTQMSHDDACRPRAPLALPTLAKSTRNFFPLTFFLGQQML